MVGGVNLDCVLTSAGESGMVERFPVRSEVRQRRQGEDYDDMPNMKADSLTQDINSSSE